MLILEREREQAFRYQRALKARGYVVAMATDGETAVRLAKENQFDVVVGSIDHEEERSGRALVNIRRTRRDVSVVLLSSGLAFSRARVAVECGAHRYLLKPVSAEQLVAVLAEAMHDRRLEVVGRELSGSARV